MDFSFVTEGSFDASHEIESDPACGRLHGHHWRVRVSAHARFDPLKGHLVDIPLAAALRSTLKELDGEHLNAMLPGTFTAPENVAAWVLERLAGPIKSVYRVEVWLSEGRGVILDREVRA
jgi:6-pyruvoyltetrahydropterin/6-carboxytetrahydropterin synthase